MDNRLFNNEESTDLADYFAYNDEQIQQHCTDEKVRHYYFEVKAAIESVAAKITSKNFMKSMKQLLVLDAKVQILFFLVEDSTNRWSGDEVIAMAEYDSKEFYEETFGLSKTNVLDHSMFFTKSA